MAKASTTLASAVAIDDNSIVVAAATSVAAGRLVRIDDEWMQVAQSYVTAATTVPVLRGQQGTAVVAHVTGALVTHGLASDFSAPPSGTAGSVTLPSQRARRTVSISATTATMDLPLIGEDLFVVLNGGSVITLTVPVPTKDLDGCIVYFASTDSTGIQHVVTFTGGIAGAGGNYDTWTNNSTAPAAFQVIACNGLWLGLVPTGTLTNIAGAIG